MTKHIPVLLEEVKEKLHLQKGMTVVDATLGGGGHASMMLAEVMPTGRVIALDADHEALGRFKERVESDNVLRQASEEERLVLVQGNYSEIDVLLERLGVETVDLTVCDHGAGAAAIAPVAGVNHTFTVHGAKDPLTALDQLCDEIEAFRRRGRILEPKDQ